MPSEIAWLQLISSVSLTIMGLTVSLVAAVFTYRNNFGWGPLVLITSIGLRGTANDKQEYCALVDVEIWNRRKYPIVVRSMSVSIIGLSMIDTGLKFAKGEWHRYRDSMVLRSDHAIAPQTHEKHKVSAPFSAPSIDALNCPIIVKFYFFDPRINRTITIYARGTYSLSSAHGRKPERWPWLRSLAT